MLYISLVSWKVWLWTTLPGRAAIWLASAELAMQKIPEICAARYLFPGEPWHDRVQPLGGDREGQLRWLFRHARSTLVQRLLGGYYYPCHLTHAHTHKFVGICMLPFNVLKCVGSGTSINPVWIKKDVFRIKHHRLRIKTILLVVVFRVQSPPRPPGPTMWFWFSWVFWSIVFFEAPASPNLMAKTQFWHRTKYVRSTAKYSKMISKVLSDPAPIFRCLRRLLTTWRTKLTHQHLPKSLGPRWWSCPSWFVPLTRSLESKVALLVIFVSFEVADEFSFPIPNQLKGWQGKS